MVPWLLLRKEYADYNAAMSEGLMPPAETVSS